MELQQDPFHLFRVSANPTGLFKKKKKSLNQTGKGIDETPQRGMRVGFVLKDKHILGNTSFL